jgi:hypothetical protein
LNFNFDSLPTNQCFKDPYETLKFLRLLEEPGSKHESNLKEFRKEYEKHLKPRERKNKREQTEAIPKITAVYNRIKDSYSSVISDGSIESMISIFKLEQWDGYKTLNISVGNNNDVEYISVHFDKLDDTYLFLQELSNLEFLTSPIIQEIEAIIEPVATLINSRK